MNELNGLQRQILDEIKEDIKKNSDMSIKDFAKDTTYPLPFW